jgi:hypothetical protein
MTLQTCHKPYKLYFIILYSPRGLYLTIAQCRNVESGIFLLVLASKLILGSESRGILDHILPSHDFGSLASPLLTHTHTYKHTATIYANHYLYLMMILCGQNMSLNLYESMD